MSNYSGNPTLASLVTSTEVPDDGKKLKASDVNVALEAAFDNFAYLRGRGVVAVHAFVVDDEAVVYQKVFSDTAYTGPKAPDLTVDVPNVAPGDLLLVDVSFGLLLLNSGNGSVRVVATDSGSNAVPIEGMRFVHNADAVRLPCALAGSWTVKSAGTTRVEVQGKVQASPTTITIEGVVSMRVVHYRSW